MFFLKAALVSAQQTSQSGEERVQDSARHPFLAL